MWCIAINYNNCNLIIDRRLSERVNELRECLNAFVEVLVTNMQPENIDFIMQAVVYTQQYDHRLNAGMNHLFLLSFASSFPSSYADINTLTIENMSGKWP